MTNDYSGKKKIPQKVLRHFPLTSHLQQLYMSSNIAKDMRWPKEKLVMMSLWDTRLVLRLSKVLMQRIPFMQQTHVMLDLY